MISDVAGAGHTYINTQDMATPTVERTQMFESLYARWGLTTPGDSFYGHPSLQTPVSQMQVYTDTRDNLHWVIHDLGTRLFQAMQYEAWTPAPKAGPDPVAGQRMVLNPTQQNRIIEIPRLQYPPEGYGVWNGPSDGMPFAFEMLQPDPDLKGFNMWQQVLYGGGAMIGFGFDSGWLGRNGGRSGCSRCNLCATRNWRWTGTGFDRSGGRRAALSALDRGAGFLNGGTRWVNSS